MYLYVCATYRTVKLTSPSLSYATVLGAVLLLVGNVFLPGFPSRSKELIAVLSLVSITNTSILCSNSMLLSACMIH